MEGRSNDEPNSIHGEVRVQQVVEIREHPRRITWRGATALALGGSNQSIFLIGALLAAQGSAAIPILILGLLLSYMAVPGWIELSCMFPNRVGGIAATCAEAFSHEPRVNQWIEFKQSPPLGPRGRSCGDRDCWCSSVFEKKSEVELSDRTH